MTGLALSTWLLVIPTHDRLGPLAPEVTAYLDQLPAGYWLSLSLVLGAIGLRLLTLREAEGWREGPGLLEDLFIVAVFGLILFGTPAVLEGTPRFFDAYGHYSLAVEIDHLDDVNFPSKQAYVGETPGAFLFFSVFRQVTGVSDLAFLNWYPVASRLLLALVAYALARTMGLRSAAVVPPLAFISGSWFEEFHVSPQSLGLVIYTMALMCLFRLWLQERAVQAARWRLLVLFFAGTAVFSHPGSPIFIGFVLGALTLAMFLVSERSRISLPFLRVQKLPATQFLGLFLIASVGFMTWELNIAKHGFGNISRRLREAIDSFLGLSLPQLDKAHVDFQQAYSNVNHLREAGYAALALVGLLAALWLLRRGRREERSIAVLLSACTVGCLFFIAVPVFTGGQYLERAALFSSLSLALLLGLVFVGPWSRSKFAFRIAALVVVGVPAALLPLTRSGSDPFELPSAAELNAASIQVAMGADGGPRLRRIGNNSGPTDYYRRLQDAEERRGEVLLAPFQDQANTLIATNPTGLADGVIRWQSGEAYEDFVAQMEEQRAKVLDAGDGIGLYYRSR